MVARKKSTSTGTNKKNQGKTDSDSTGTVKKVKKKADTRNPVVDKNDAKSVTVILDSVITLSEVTELRKKLLGYIDVEEIKIDATKVEHIDTGGMQLLLSLYRAFSEQDKRIDWLGWSGACKHTAELLGLKKALGIKDN